MSVGFFKRGFEDEEELKEATVELQTQNSSTGKLEFDSLASQLRSFEGFKIQASCSGKANTRMLIITKD